MRYTAYVLALLCALGACTGAPPAKEPLIQGRADKPRLALTAPSPVASPMVLSVADKPPLCEQECARQRERAIGYPRIPKQRDKALAALAAICDDGGAGACRAAKVVVSTGDPRLERSHELSFSLANQGGELVMREVRCGMHKGRLLAIDHLVLELDLFAKRAAEECPVQAMTSLKIEFSFEAGQVMGLISGAGASDEVLMCVRRAAESSKTSLDGVCAGTLELAPRLE